MYSSFILFSLLIASTMAFPPDFPPYKFHPYNFPSFNFPPNYKFYSYNFPPFNFAPNYKFSYNSPPSTSSGVSPPGNGYAQAPPLPSSNQYGTPPPGSNYRLPSPPQSNQYGNPPAASSGNDKDEFLVEQNAARKAITGANLPMLVWNETLAAYALNYANKRKGDCALQHSGGPYGENIAQGVGLMPKDAVKLWVDEKSLYDYASNGCSAGPGQMCLHYTQIIWKGTTQIGCARVACDGGAGCFATCNYYPPGNFDGERPY